jgi:hypothetical protein
MGVATACLEIYGCLLALTTNLLLVFVRFTCLKDETPGWGMKHLIGE